jgi:hypothetical protein
MPRLALQLTGLEEENGRVRLNVFTEALQHLIAGLRRADEIASGGHATQFEIVTLSYTSQVLVEVEMRRASEKAPNVGREVLATYQRHFTAIAAGKIREEKVDYDLLGHIRELIEPVNKKRLQSLALSVNEHRFELMPEYVGRIEHALAATDYCIGTVDGMLERMNIHAGANIFTLYPIAGPTQLKCHFSAANRDKALAAMGRRVEATGRLAYRHDEQLPYSIEVETLAILPADDKLTSLSDLRGMAPDATGDLSSEDYVAELRSGW